MDALGAAIRCWKQKNKILKKNDFWRPNFGGSWDFTVGRHSRCTYTLGSFPGFGLLAKHDLKMRLEHTVLLFPFSIVNHSSDKMTYFTFLRDEALSK